MRIIWVVGGSFGSVKREEVEAVLGGARLVEKRELFAEAIRRAAMVEDALAHNSTARASSDNRLTPELAMAYERASQPMSPLRAGRWMAYATRERGNPQELHNDAGEVPGPVRGWTAPNHFYLVTHKGRGSVNRSPQRKFRGAFVFSGLVTMGFARAPGAHADGAARSRERAVASTVAAADSFSPLSASAGERETKSG